MIPAVENSVSPNQRSAVRDLDTNLCFQEREERLWSFQADEVPGPLRYASAFAWVMDGLSTPYSPGEKLAGRLVLGPLPGPATEPGRVNWLERVHSSLLFSPGHMTLDYRSVIVEGLSGILQRATALAQANSLEHQSVFAKNSHLCLSAVRRWLDRYVQAIRRAEGGETTAEALDHAPWRPARTFHEGLQACWLVHLILSGVVGGRDFGFGRLDQILWPLLESDLAAGRTTPEETKALITEFFLKLNALAGNARGYPDARGGHQPTPCTGTKQYIVLGGTDPDGHGQANQLSFWFLEAAQAVRLREPVLHVRYDPEVDDAFREAAVKASVVTQGQVQFANEVFTVSALIRAGVPVRDAHEYGASACSRLDLGATHGNGERWLLTVPWLLDYANSGEALAADDFRTFLEGFLHQASETIRAIVRQGLPDAEPFYDIPFVNDGGPHFHLESLFVADCVEKKRHLCEGGGRYRLHLLCFVGMASLVNSLCALRELVYASGKISLSDFLAMLEENFADAEEFRTALIEECPKFGNDDPSADDLAGEVGRAFLDAIESVEMPPGQFTLGCFYSLITHLWGGQGVGASFDGRLAGQPFSENQSPVYGTDRAGITALLNSLSKLPFDRAVSGSLNLLFPANADARKIRALLDAYFRKGGSMVGLTFADRAQLEDAMEHPERHPFLQVRMHGFSEYFVNMPREEQEEVLARTAAF